MEAARARGRQDGARDDPHAPGQGHTLRHGRVHGMHYYPSVKRRREGIRGLRLLEGERQVRALQDQGRDNRHRGNWKGLQGYVQFLGIHGRRTGPRLRSRGGSDRYGVRAVPPDRHGLAPERKRHPRHRGRKGRGRDSHEQERREVHGKIRPREDGAIDERRRREVDLHGGHGGTRLAPRRGLPRHIAQGSGIR